MIYVLGVAIACVALGTLMMVTALKDRIQFQSEQLDMQYKMIQCLDRVTKALEGKLRLIEASEKDTKDV